MDILEVIALLSLCIACIKLGMEINKTQKNNRPPLWKHHKNILTYIKESVQRTSCESLALYAFYSLELQCFLGYNKRKRGR